MEYAAGGELLHRIRKRQRLPDAEAKFYAAEIADALQYMHNEVGCTDREVYARENRVYVSTDGNQQPVPWACYGVLGHPDRGFARWHRSQLSSLPTNPQMSPRPSNTRRTHNGAWCFLCSGC